MTAARELWQLTDENARISAAGKGLSGGNGVFSTSRMLGSRMGRKWVYPGSFWKSVKQKGLKDAELGRIYGRS